MLAVGARQNDELGFPADEVAARHGASVERDTTDGDEAYGSSGPYGPSAAYPQPELRPRLVVHYATAGG